MIFSRLCESLENIFISIELGLSLKNDNFLLKLIFENNTVMKFDNDVS